LIQCTERDNAEILYRFASFDHPQFYGAGWVVYSQGVTTKEKEASLAYGTTAIFMPLAE
jgi:hypothetical protein